VKIINDRITLSEIRQMAAGRFGDMVKAVVDVNQELFALDAELHSDLEALLLEAGSRQQDLWGINLYPELTGADFIEFDSMINLRPSQNNLSRGVDNEEMRRKINEVVSKRISQ
jgi:hypothetical protein